MVTVYCEHISPRFVFVFKEIFENRIGVPCRFINNEHDFNRSSNEVFINYSSNEHINGFRITPSSILFENDISEKNIDLNYWGDLPIFFETKCETGFDLPGAVFFLLSRYEEYLPFVPDKHGRFPHTESIAYKHNFLHRPLVDEWILKFSEILAQKFSGFNPKKQEIRIEKTLDIDILLKYGGRGFLRNTAGWLRDLISFNLNAIKERFAVLTKLSADPYFNFDYQLAAGKRQEQKFIYFFLVGKYGPFDKNLSIHHPLMQKIIKQLSDAGHEIGLHPSYASGDFAETIATEKNTLEKIVGKEIHSCRRHFLKFALPNTYRAALDAGFSDEYSMGYSEIVGFRASTAHTFCFFDLIDNNESSLTIHPFCAMDVALEYYMMKNPAEAILELSRLKSYIENSGGTLSIVFHNESLGNQKQWKGWRDVWEY